MVLQLELWIIIMFLAGLFLSLVFGCHITIDIAALNMHINACMYACTYGRFHRGREMTTIDFFFFLLWRLQICGFIFKLSVPCCMFQKILRCGPQTFSLPVSLVELASNSLCSWLPNIFLKFGASWVAISTHLVIRRGITKTLGIIFL